MQAKSNRPTVVLDDIERQVIRDEIHLEASSFGDVALDMSAGARSATVDHLELLREHIDVLDCIGWTDGPKAPRRQVVTDPGPLRRYATRKVAEVRSCLATAAAADVDGELATFAILRRVAIAAAEATA